mgnify:CR=1 FL=1
METGLLRKPEHNVGVRAEYRTGNGLQFSFDGEYAGERTDLFFNPANNFASEKVLLDSYFLANMSAEYQFPGNQLAFYGSLRNLFDANFTEVYGFNTLGLHANIGARFKF